uniref:Uncharacterized protein n=1 Tax=Leersia perrieri TaxID=77586 RepID=A0A0D9VNH0_9ORYZ
MDAVDFRILGEIMAMLTKPSDAEKEALFPHYTGNCSTSTHPPGRLTMDASPSPSAAAALFPQFTGDCSAQPPPTLGGTMAAAADFPYYNGNGEGSSAPIPPTMSGGCSSDLSGMEMETTPSVPLDAVPNPFVGHGLITPDGKASTEDMYQFLIEILDDEAGQSQPMPAGAGIMEGNDKWMMAAGVAPQEPPPASLHQHFMMNSAADAGVMPWESQFVTDSLLGTNQTTIDDNMAAAEFDYDYPHDPAAVAWGTDKVVVQEIPYTDTPAFDHPQQHLLDNEDMEMEMAEIYRVASQCDEEESIVWSPDDDKLLLDRLNSRLANQDMVSICIEIAYSLPKKTSKDVASRIQWLQLVHVPSMFEDAKTKIDAILMKMRKMNISTDEFKINLEAFEEVKRGLHPLTNGYEMWPENPNPLSAQAHPVAPVRTEESDGQDRSPGC